MTLRSAAPRPRTAAFALLAALGGPAGASTARAAPRDVVNVLELAADFDDVSTAQALTNVLRLRVGDGSDFLLASDNTSFGVAAAEVRCDVRGYRAEPLRLEADRGVDARCLRSVGVHLGSKRYFWGHLYREPGGRPGVKLHLWRDDRGDAVKALPLEGATAGARERLVGRLYEHLVHPERAADVRLGGAALGAGGELFIDGASAGLYAPGDEVTVAAGERAFELRRGGAAVGRAKATVAVGRATEVRLEAVATATAPEGPRPVSLPTPVTPSGRGAWKRPAGFVGLGLGAALVGAGLVAGLRVRGIGDDFASDPALAAYRRGRPDSEPCDGAESGITSSQAGAATPGRVHRLCAGFSTLRVTQYVFYGLGGLTMAAGTYLLATAPRRAAATGVGADRRAPTWSLYPSAGTKAGALHLEVTFLAGSRHHGATWQAERGNPSDSGRDRGRLARARRRM